MGRMGNRQMIAGPAIDRLAEGLFQPEVNKLKQLLADSQEKNRRKQNELAKQSSNYRKALNENRQLREANSDLKDANLRLRLEIIWLKQELGQASPRDILKANAWQEILEKREAQNGTDGSDSTPPSGGSQHCDHPAISRDEPE